MPERKDAARSPNARRRLGRGLSSLLSASVPVSLEADVEATGTESRAETGPAGQGGDGAGAVRFIRPQDIKANPNQPRQHFDETALQALAASIRSAGLMQPIVVRPADGGGFQLVVGERRLRAARNLGLTSIPALVRQIDDRAAAEWALIENVQREDLNPLERAEAFRNLTERFGMTHQEAADRIGLNRSTVTNLMRLLDLDEVTRAHIQSGRLGAAHGRALLSITNLDARKQLADLAVREGWTVRMMERRVASLGPPGGASRRRPAASAGPANRHDLEKRLGDHLGTKVRIHPGKRKGTGRLDIEFFSLDQFDGLMSRLGFKAGL